MSSTVQKTGEKKTIILETGFTGHRNEYVRHLMMYINSNPQLYGLYIFFLHEKMKDLIGELATSANYVICYFPFANKYKNYVAKSFSDWRLLEPSIDQFGSIQEIIFMELDPYLILIRSRAFRKKKLTVSGIIFQPYIHFELRDKEKKRYTRDFVKNYILQKTTLYTNRQVNKLFILNDEQGVKAMNRTIRRSFHFLPDPIVPELGTEATRGATDFSQKYAIKENQKILLSFGTIDERKNLLNIIDALRYLPQDLRQQVHLIIAGKFNSAVREKYIGYISQHQDQLNITYCDSYVTDEEREFLFARCSVVLMPYVNFYSSSGVLGHAVKHGKKLIASNQGLVGRLVSDHQLGLAVDPTDPRAIGNAITQLLTDSTSINFFQEEYLMLCDPENFSKTILSH